VYRLGFEFFHSLNFVYCCNEFPARISAAQQDIPLPYSPEMCTVSPAVFELKSAKTPNGNFNAPQLSYLLTGIQNKKEVTSNERRMP